MEQKFDNGYYSVVFWILLVAIFLFLGFHIILWMPPQGIHFMRQSDCLAFASNYYHHGLHFFEPQVYNLQSSDGKAVSEFPILYYLTALIYSVIGEQEWVLRLLNISIVSIGLWHLYLLIKLWMKDNFYAISLSLLFSSSTVFLYYTNNFLPDSPALGFVLMGWYYFFVAANDNFNSRKMSLAFIFFAFSSLLKISFLGHLIAALASIFFAIKFSSIKPILNGTSKKIIILYGFISITIPILWILYARNYNINNHDAYFLLNIKPIWILTWVEIKNVYGYMTGYWYTRYYYPSSFHLFYAAIILGILYFPKKITLLHIATIFLFIYTCCYIALFFPQFKDHDYYFIAIIPCLIFVVTTSIINIQHKKPNYLLSIPIKALVLIICSLSINYARQKIKERYLIKTDQFNKMHYELSSIKDSIDSLNIETSSKCIILGDISMNGGLYAMKRQGWIFKDLTDIDNIKMCINNGAQFIVASEKIDFSCINIYSRMVLHKPPIYIYKLSTRN